MSEENRNEETQGESRTFTQEELERIIKDRLKNKHTETADLQQRNAELERQIAEAQAQQQATVQQPEQAQIPQAAQITDATTQGVAPTGQPLTAEDMQAVLAQHQQQQTLQNVYNQQVASIQKMKDEDPEFAKLADTSRKDEIGIPEAVAIKISQALGYEPAKKLFKELLSNETSNLKMNLAAHRGEDSFNRWLSQAVEQSKRNQAEAPGEVPELGNETASGVNESSDDNINSYLSGLS